MVVLYLPLKKRISEAYSRTAIFTPVCNRFSLITFAKIDAFDCKTMIFHYLFNEIRLFILSLNN